MRHDPGHAEPASLVVTMIGVGKTGNDADAGRKIRIERRRDEVERDFRHAPLHRRVAKCAPRWFGLIDDPHPFVQERVLIHLQPAAKFAARQVEAHKLTGHKMFGGHPQSTGQFGRQSVRVVAARQESRYDLITLQRYQRRRVRSPAVRKPVAIGDPTGGHPRLREICQRLKGRIGRHSSRSHGGPLGSECRPGRLDISIRFEQPGEWIGNVIDRRLRCIGDFERSPPHRDSEFDRRPLFGHVLTNQAAQFFQPCNRRVILSRRIGWSADPARRHKHCPNRVEIALRNRL